MPPVGNSRGQKNRKHTKQMPATGPMKGSSKKSRERERLASLAGFKRSLGVP